MDKLEQELAQYYDIYIEKYRNIGYIEHELNKYRIQEEEKRQKQIIRINKMRERLLKEEVELLRGGGGDSKGEKKMNGSGGGAGGRNFNGKGFSPRSGRGGGNGSDDEESYDDRRGGGGGVNGRSKPNSRYALLASLHHMHTLNTTYIIHILYTL